MTHHPPPKPHSAPHSPATPSPHHPTPAPPQPAPAPVPAPPAPVPAPVGVRAISARAFIDKVFVNTHASYTGTAYDAWPKAIEAVKWLGITGIRDHLPLNKSERYAEAARAGLRCGFFLPGLYDRNAKRVIETLAQHMARLEAFATANPGGIVALEGSNEVNFWPTPWPQDPTGKTDIPSQVALHRTFYQAVKRSPVLKNIPVACVTLGAWGKEGHQLLGDMRDCCDLANVHIYFGPGDPPRVNWDYAQGLGQVEAKGKPTAITECGYSTAVMAPNKEGVDEATQAKFTLAMVLRAQLKGAAQVAIYELADQKPDPGLANIQQHYGLFRVDWTPKPAATALRNMLGVIGAGKGAVSEGTLAYTVTGMPANSQQLLFQDGDGAFVIALWPEPDIWDQVARKTIPAPASDVTVSFGKPVASWEVFDPLVADKAVTFGANTSSARARISDHVVLVRVKL